MSFFHDGHRALQDRFDSRRIADRLEQVTVHAAFSDADRAFVEQAPFFFLATADAEGRPDCSYKGGLPGFVKVVADNALAWTDLDGNGEFRSLGNIHVNPRVGLLFIDFTRARRMRVNGTASLDDQRVVRVTAEHIFPNCPRNIHKMSMDELTPFDADPNWKRDPKFCDALPKKS